LRDSPIVHVEYVAKSQSQQSAVGSLCPDGSFRHHYIVPFDQPRDRDVGTAFEALIDNVRGECCLPGGLEPAGDSPDDSVRKARENLLAVGFSKTVHVAQHYIAIQRHGDPGDALPLPTTGLLQSCVAVVDENPPLSTLVDAFAFMVLGQEIEVAHG
jgi:hypothetical protein